ncbi:MAG TPA: ribonuclease R [Nitrospirae bacterium]|nr:ribonuclease R [Nitrospirota bacterium]HDO22759.1 ribonuclease R [Nitrospirota bacterium]HDZ87983.1 ribonuclease R [Nitrospirota bacterium]
MKRQDILAHIRSNKKPLSFRALAESLGLPKKFLRTLKRLLKDMVNDGEIIRTRKGMYGPAGEMRLETGYFEAHKEGYGFVILEKLGEKDIFVPARATMGAMNNDRVMVRVDNLKKREGRIVRILERAYNRVAGVIDVDGESVFLRPKSRKVPFDIYIPFNMKGDAKNGDVAVAEITDYPTDKRPPRGRVVKIISPPDDPKSEIEAIIDEMSLPRRFPHEVTDVVRMLSKEASDMKEGRRRDLTALSTVTVDGETARDFDDAISVRCIPDGYRLYVHIADVSHYVKWNDVIDMEARSRGTSVYFPDRVLPMFPKVISEDLCSLRPHVKRLAFTAEMDFSRNGHRIRESFYPSVIESNNRMTYNSVKKILIDQDAGERKKYESLLYDFELMSELTNILRSKRMQRGSLDFDLPEPEIILDLKGNLEAIISAERNFAHIIIEEFMIAANEAVSEYIESKGVPSLYRVHEEPDESKLDNIMAVLRGATNIRKRKVTPRDIPLLLESLRGQPAEEAFNYIVLRSLKQARYSTENIGHFGLASQSYTHFTSPIRRYPDLVIHRILRDLIMCRKGLPDKKLKIYESLLPDIALHSSRRERVADEAEREVVDAMRAWFMKGRVGSEFAGRITGIAPYGIKVRLKDFYIEGFIHISDMTNDFYIYNESDLTFRGKHTKKVYRIGQDIRILVEKVNMQERETVFSLV